MRNINDIINSSHLSTRTNNMKAITILLLAMSLILSCSPCNPAEPESEPLLLTENAETDFHTEELLDENGE